MTLTKEILQETSLVRIVDDDPALRRALTFFLKVEGWKSVSYDGPFSFLEKDDPKMPGCLVLDLKMPGATGTDLQHQLKVEENVLPVIFLSAHGDIDTAVYAVLEGAVDFLQKPVDEERLLRAVEKACRMHHERLRGGPGEDEARARWETLTERERDIIKYFFGIGCSEMTLEEIGEKFDLTRERVRQIKEKAIRRLRHSSRSKLLKSYLG